ncbi:enoyl-CoA hydratase-related protein [Martelella sp. FLE1502]
MTGALVKLEMKGSIAVLRLNAPDRLNALSLDLLTELRSVLRATAEDADVRCLVVTGEGRGFCAGADLNEAGSDPDQSVLETVYHPILRRLRDFPVPIVAAVNGPAVGAGMSLALMADILIASENAYFQQAFRNIGLVPDCGATWLLPRAIGRPRANLMSLTGERVTATTALDWGMAAEVVAHDNLLPRAIEIANMIASGPSNALRRTRELYWRTYDTCFEEQIALEDLMQREAVASGDFREGVEAFINKRPPSFLPRSGTMR